MSPQLVKDYDTSDCEDLQMPPLGTCQFAESMFFGLEAKLRSTQSFLLDLRSGITPGRLGGPYGTLGIESSLLCVRLCKILSKYFPISRIELGASLNRA